MLFLFVGVAAVVVRCLLVLFVIVVRCCCLLVLLIVIGAVAGDAGYCCDWFVCNVVVLYGMCCGCVCSLVVDCCCFVVFF